MNRTFSLQKGGSQEHISLITIMFCFNEFAFTVQVKHKHNQTDSRWNQSAGGRARSASDIPQTRVGVARSCNYHAQAIRHIRHLLTAELAQILACSLILSRMDYFNAVLHCTQSYSMKKLQRVQNNAARIVLEAPRRFHASSLLRTSQWLPVQQRIDYKVALLTFKVCSTSTPSYLRRLIQDRQHNHNLRSATTTLCQLSTFHSDDVCEARLLMLCSGCLELTTIRYDTRCYFNVRSKADISQLNLPHGTDN